eukprot:4285724-Amphidinium_carterae.1
MGRVPTWPNASVQEMFAQPGRLQLVGVRTLQRPVSMDEREPGHVLQYECLVGTRYQLDDRHPTDVELVCACVHCLRAGECQHQRDYEHSRHPRDSILDIPCNHRAPPHACSDFELGHRKHCCEHLDITTSGRETLIHGTQALDPWTLVADIFDRAAADCYSPAAAQSSSAYDYHRLTQSNLVAAAAAAHDYRRQSSRNIDSD